MLKTFITSFKLQNTYRTNSIIYSIKQLPLIKRILPNSLYKSKGLKIFAGIISILLEIINIFIGKIIYIAAMIFMALSWYHTNQADTFIHIFTFLTLAGGVLNTYMLNPTKDKYYAIIQMNNNFKVKTNEILLVYLPYFVFIMYCINRSSNVTTAMFMNCDHSMLTYRIYRTPKVILGIFKERLKTLITINLLPAFLIGGGLSLLLYLSGGTDNPINYVIQFVSIIAMSIFFSVHYLVMYYLLQPYNVNREI